MSLIQFKFLDSVLPEQRTEVLSTLETSGAGKARPAFPPTTRSPALQAVFHLDAGDDRIAQELVKRLSKLPEVEFAEIAPRRTLRKK
ncbi:MAG: hypothetical protein ACKV0T_02675 [Planctomycetales bacterium]